ncbi:MAG: hypothetical protein KGK06_00520, partial [Xanthomonadaceae bacterium]|nr:hypothetical protein [Xanthomonadaceae bacterium]
TLFDVAEGRLGVVVTFLAMLELAKEMLIEIVQEAPLAPIYLKARAGVEGVLADAMELDDANDQEAGESAFETPDTAGNGTH